MNDNLHETQKPCPQRLRRALELQEMGIAMKRAQIRRANPNYSELEIQKAMRAWQLKRGVKKFSSTGQIVYIKDIK